MNDQNKNNVSTGLKKPALAIWALLTAATCAGVWNFCPEKSVKIAAGVLLACNGFAIYRLWKKSDN